MDLIIFPYGDFTNKIIALMCR